MIFLAFLALTVWIEAATATLFTIHFDKGAIWACTVYEQIGTDYAPRHCGALSEDQSWYVDNWAYIEQVDVMWAVWAEV